MFCRALLRVRRPQRRLVDQVHRVVEEERLVLVPPEEIEGEVLDHVGTIGALGQVQIFAVLVVLRFPVPATGRIVGKVLVKAPVAAATRPSAATCRPGR